MKLFKKTVSEDTASKAKTSSKFNWKTNRKLRIGATSTAITAAFVALIVLFNVVVGIINERYPFSWDLTSAQTYSLSEESYAVAERVKEEVTITVLLDRSYFENPNTGDDNYNVLLRQFSEFTKEYSTLTDGKVKTEYVDLVANPTLESKYKPYDATTGSIIFERGDQWRTITVNDLYEEYSSSSSDDYYNTDSTTTIYSQVERVLASNINAVCAERNMTVSFLTGHGEKAEYISALETLYRNNGYLVERVDFSTSQEIDESSAALVLVGPDKEFSDAEIARLRTWLDNGGKRERHLMVFCDYTAQLPNLYEFLEVDYGITVTDKVILETDTSKIFLNSGYVDGFSSQTTITENDLIDGGEGENVRMTLTLQLLSAWPDDDEEFQTSQPLVTFTDSVKLVSAHDANGKGTGETQETPSEETVYGMVAANDYDGSTGYSNYVIVSGSYHMLSDIGLTTVSNEDLVLKPIRTICDLGDTVTISMRDLTPATVQFSVLTYLILGLGVLTYGLPLIFIVIAVVVFIRRRHL